MTLAARPLLFILLLTFAASTVEAKKTAVATKVTACSNFYGNINNDWLQTHPLPADKDSRSRWDELNELALKQTHDLITSTQSTTSGTASTLLANLVASGLDEASMETSGKQVLLPLLAQINGIRKSKDIARVVTFLNTQGVPVLYKLDVLRDPDTGQPRATLLPSGLGLIDPQFYTSSDTSLQRIVTVYRTYLAELLKLSGVAENKSVEQAGWVLAIETELAKSMSPDGVAVSPAAQVARSTARLALPDFMKAQAAASTSAFYLQQPGYFKTADRLVDKTPIAQWQAYLRMQVVHALAPTLDKNYRSLHGHMFDVVLEGNAVPNTLAAQVSALITEQASDLLNAAYAERYLSNHEEDKADAIAEAVRAAMARAIDRANWLSVDGERAAHSKLEALRLAIGRRTMPVSFATLSFQRDQYTANLLAFNRWKRERALDLLSSTIWPWPVDQTHPLIGYEPSENRLIVTAAALQAPVFEGKSSAADYGALGALVAQQMSLGFNMFDGNDAQAWQQRSAALIRQYDGYTLAGSSKVNGSKTQAMNAADLAGLELAWDALNFQGKVDFAAKKTFFSAWASLWARQDRESALIVGSNTSVFAPSQWRVNGPLSNLPDFQKTYACKAGQAMSKPERDQIALWR